MKKHLHSPLANAPTNAFRSTALLFAGVLAALPAQAVIHLNPNPALYEAAPLTAPANAIPWDNVGRFSNASGGQISGSLVLIKGKYVLTANHVIVRSHVTFDGTTYYAVDTTFTPVKIGTADLKVVKLVENPGLPEVTIADFNHTTSSLYAPLYIIGWGQGKSTSQTTPVIDSTGGTVWNWGGPSAKRWGTSNTLNITPVTSYTGYNYSYSSIRTRLTSTAPLASEAGLANFDSGGGGFVHHNGQWYLAGIATTVTTGAGANTSRFGTGTLRDSNSFVSLFSVRAAVLAQIPDEPDLPDLSTFEGWLEANSLSGADAAPDADPDGDGMANLSEFAFGTNPVVHDNASAPALQAKSGGGFAFRYQLSKVATGVSIDVVHSADVINWSPVPGTPVVVEDTAEYTVYEIEVFPSATSGGERFYTVTVTLED